MIGGSTRKPRLAFQISTPIPNNPETEPKLNLNTHTPSQKISLRLGALPLLPSPFPLSHLFFLPFASALRCGRVRWKRTMPDIVGTTCNVTIYPSFVHTRLSISGPDDNALYTIAEGLSDHGATEKIKRSFWLLVIDVFNCACMRASTGPHQCKLSWLVFHIHILIAPFYSLQAHQQDWLALLPASTFSRGPSDSVQLTERHT
jgi:hypothetical protein